MPFMSTLRCQELLETLGKLAREHDDALLRLYKCKDSDAQRLYRYTIRSMHRQPPRNKLWCIEISFLKEAHKLTI